MLKLAAKTNPSRALVADYFVCRPSEDNARSAAIGIAMGNATLVETAAMTVVVALVVWLSKKCSKNKHSSSMSATSRTACTRDGARGSSSKRTS